MTTGPLVVAVFSHRSPQQITRLVKRLSEGSNTVVVVHHDPSGEPLDLTSSENVIRFPRPVPVQWGRHTQVDAQLGVLDWARREIPELSWLLTISGQDYPVRRLDDIQSELAASDVAAYLRHFKVGDPADDTHVFQAIARTRYLRQIRVPYSSRAATLPWRPHPFGPGLELYGGEFWLNLSAPAIDAVLDSPYRRRLKRFSRWVPNPDELVVPTLLRNSRPELAVTNDHRRFIKWVTGRPSPETVTTDQLDEIAASTAFFARKLDNEQNPQVPDALDELADRRSGQ